MSFPEKNYKCCQCGCPEEFDASERSNLLHVCIDRIEGDYDYYCKKCMGLLLNSGHTDANGRYIDTAFPYEWEGFDPLPFPCDSLADVCFSGA